MTREISPSFGEYDVRGKWRPASAADCSNGALLIVSDHQIDAVDQDSGKSVTLGFDIEIVKVPQADGPVLVLHPWHEPPGILMLLHTDLRGEEFRFVTAEWAEGVKVAYGERFNELMPLPQFVGNLQRGQPYSRCP